MIRTKDLQDAFINVVGWEQFYNTQKAFICEDMTKSESGLYFQSVHPLITYDNLFSIAPDFSENVREAFDATKTYNKNSVVSFNGELYRARTESVGLNPDTSDAWVKTTEFSEWLNFKTRASIQKLISRFVNDKLNKGTYKNLVEEKTLFDGTGRIYETERNKNNLVGFEIVPVRAKGITTKINRIGLQFSKAGQYVLYLLHSSQSEPVRTFSFTKTKANSMEWFSVEDVFLPYESADIDTGGSWYLCYFQSSLPTDSEAIKKDYDWSKGPCKSCSRSSFESWKAWSKHIEIHPFYIGEEHIHDMLLDNELDTGIEQGNICMWDIEKNTYDYVTNYGINLDITISCDLTDMLIEQRGLFSDLISKQVAIDVLKEFAFNANVRTNRHSINASRLDILTAIEGDASQIHSQGLSYMLEQAYKAVELDISGISRICMPCTNNGIKYRTV